MESPKPSTTVDEESTTETSENIEGDVSTTNENNPDSTDVTDVTDVTDTTTGVENNDSPSTKTKEDTTASESTQNEKTIRGEKEDSPEPTPSDKSVENSDQQIPSIVSPPTEEQTNNVPHAPSISSRSIVNGNNGSSQEDIETPVSDKNPQVETGGNLKEDTLWEKILRIFS